jgi:DNA polymerase-1
MVQIINTATLSPTDRHDSDTALWLYNGLDAAVTYEINDVITPMLDNTSSTTYAFSQALQAPVLDMMQRGLLVNQVKKHEVLREMRAHLTRLEEQLTILVEDGVGVKGLNWRSPVQLNNLLYDIMGLPEVKKRNANGIFARTSNREAIEKLSTYFIAEPICNHLMLLRDLGKSISFLQTGIDADGRMRSNVNIAGTITGRFASSVSDFGTGTNLQNVTPRLRSVFVADPGYKLANLDLEQADARNVGALCWNELVNRPDWTEADAGRYLDFCESGDLHTNVCKMANPDLPWGTAPDREIADRPAYRHLSYRDLMKKLGHGSNFYGQPPTMAKHAKLPISLVKDFQTRYFGLFPCITEWHKSIRAALLSHAQLTTPFNRRRFFFGRPNEDSTLREAIAHQPQSMTGDEINTGILRLWRANRVQLLMQVHDSILFQFPEDEEETIVPWALEVLKTHLTLAKGRPFVVPTEAMTGWKKWKGSDARKRTEIRFKLSVLSM